MEALRSTAIQKLLTSLAMLEQVRPGMRITVTADWDDGESIVMEIPRTREQSHERPAARA